MANLKNGKKNSSGGLYIALAVCVLSVICVGVYGAVLGLVKPITGAVEGSDDRDDSKPRVIVETPIRETEGNQNQTVSPPVTTPAPTVPTEKSEPEVQQNVSATPAPPTYVLPLVGSVVKDFSQDLLVYSETMNDYRIHNGIDLAAVIGERVKALTDGVVEKVYEDPLMGQTVILDHGNGLKSVHQNLLPEVPDGITEGSAVKAGDVIGGVGETALIECAEEPHLHLEVWKDGVPTDPRAYFE